jgi:hypothetical protein
MVARWEMNLPDRRLHLHQLYRQYSHNPPPYTPIKRLPLNRRRESAAFALSWEQGVIITHASGVI